MRYDVAGNLTNDTYTGVGNRTYDAENKITSAWGGSNQAQVYSYDASGQRIKRKVDGVETWQVYGFGGELVAEYPKDGGVSTPQKEYGYRNGQLLVTAETTAQIHWLVTDQVGTSRMVLDQTGSLANVKRHDYLPFGKELFGGTVEQPGPGGRTTAQGYSGGDGGRQQFTSKERDNETGLDYFGARYFSSTQGRFTGADPISLGVDRLFDPQRFNRYAYVRNNPLMFTDPDGRDIVLGSGDQKRAKQALVEIAKRPGGRELLTKLDKLTVQLVFSSGSLHGKAYGSIEGPYTRTVVTNTETGKVVGVVDVKGGPVNVTLDFERADADRKENNKRTENNKGMKAMGLPEKPLIEDVPKSDAELTGHEIEHGVNRFFGLPNTEASATGGIDAILDKPVDKNLAKDAEKFVDNLVQPNQPQPQSQPTPEPKKKPEDE